MNTMLACPTGLFYSCLLKHNTAVYWPVSSGAGLIDQRIIPSDWFRNGPVTQFCSMKSCCMFLMDSCTQIHTPPVLWEQLSEFYLPMKKMQVTLENIFGEKIVSQAGHVQESNHLLLWQQPKIQPWKRMPQTKLMHRGHSWETYREMEPELCST